MIAVICMAQGVIIKTKSENMSHFCKISCALNSLLELIFGNEYGKIVYGVFWVLMGIIFLSYAIGFGGRQDE